MLDVVELEDLWSVGLAGMLMVIEMWVVLVDAWIFAGEGREMGAVLAQRVDEVFEVGGLVFYGLLGFFNFICQQHL